MTDRAEALRQRLLATFRIEAEEHLVSLGATLDELERDPDPAREPARLEALFREMHTLKGAARSVGLDLFEAKCHECEAMLSEVIKAGGSLPPGLLRTLQDTCDELARIVADWPSANDSQPAAAAARPLIPPLLIAPTPTPVPAPAVAPAPPPAVAAAPPVTPAPAVAPPPSAPRPAAAAAPMPVAAAAETVRVDVDRLEYFSTLTERMLGPKLAAQEHAREARAIAEDIERLRAYVTAPEARDELRSIEARMRTLVTGLRTESGTLATAVDDLYAEMQRVRMMPAAGMFEAFPRMVRDLARETGKEVEWQLVGGHHEIDRMVLDNIKDPLIHLVRNAIDHGLESPAERSAAGKPAQGHVTVTVASRAGGHIRVEVTDDGRGFAVDALRSAAVRAHVLSADQAASMSDADVADLAYAAGVSTSPVVTTISGHGRGLAIVRERLERIEGSVSTASEPGRGTTIRLEFRAGIVTHRALLAEVAGTRFLMPLESVVRVFALPAAEAEAALTRGLITTGGRALPFGRLATILRVPFARDASTDARPVSCVLLHGDDRDGVVAVDDILGEFEVVIKPFSHPLRRIRNVLAAGLLASGELVLVTRPSDILRSIHARGLDDGAAPADEIARVVRILVVDDSITTRTMERNLFEAAGYAVRVAVDGLDAWNIVQTEVVDVVVSDVDMPNMNGFELTTAIRNSTKLADLPVVLVTALETREDKERGLRVGANAYVLKSGFNQADLLEIVRRLA